MNSQDIKNLKKRYLIWLYKTTKEVLDKIERKFTQLEIDKFIYKELKKINKDSSIGKFLDEFQVYIQNKQKEALNLKFVGKDLKPDYRFLVLKLKAIEKSILKELGAKALKEIKSLYEKEMVESLMESRLNERSEVKSSD